MKTRKAALATAAVAGLAALPLSASAAGTLPAPNGLASASALTVQVSLQPLKNIVDTAGAGKLSWQTVVDALTTIRTAVCGSGDQTKTDCPLNTTLPTDLPGSLSVSIAQAQDKATLNEKATDLVSGSSSSTPVATDWQVLNANISALQSALSALLAGDLQYFSSALTSGDLTKLQNLNLQNLSNLSLNTPLFSVGNFNILGTVSAALPGQSFDSSKVVQITGASDQITNGLNVTVDPFQAVAVDSAHAGSVPGELHVTGPQASASNNLVTVKLPDLLTSVLDTSGLKNLAATIDGLIHQITAIIANPSSLTTTVTSALPPVLQDPLNLISSTVSGVVGTTTGQLDLSALKALDSQLSNLLDAVNGLADALAQLQLPDVTNLIESTQDIATAKTAPMAAGGVASSATANLGNLSVLPMGASLAGVLNTAINTVNGALGSASPLQTVTDKTALLSIDGITATADAAVGPGTSHPVGTSGLHSISILGQPIDLETVAGKLGLAPGTELSVALNIPVVGAVTLDITRGVQQIVADTESYREVHMAALDVRLINGCDACPTGLSINGTPVGSTSSAKTATTSSGAMTNGVKVLGDDGAQVLEVAAPQTIAAASMNTLVDNPTPPQNCTANCDHTNPGLVNTPTTGMFGAEGGLAAGGLLLAVAISLRLVPGLRERFGGVR